MDTKFSKVFWVSLALFAVIFGIYFVMANSASLTSANVGNGTNVTMMWFNVSATNTTIGNLLTSITINNTGTATGLNVTMVTVSNGTSSYSNSSFGPSFPVGGVVISIGRIVNLTASTNFTVNFTVNSTATDASTLRANITSNVSEANVTFGPVLSGSNYLSGTTTIDTVAPLVTYASQTLSNLSNNTGNLIINVTATDTVSNVMNITLLVNGAVVRTCSGNVSSSCNYTNNSVDGTYNISAYANDTYGHTNNSLANRTVTIDNTNPVPVATCTPDTIGKGDIFPCTCTATDVTSGVSSSTGTSNSGDGTNIPSTSGDFIFTCSATDFAGNTVNTTDTYSVTGGSGGSSGGSASGGSSETTAKPEVQTFTKITPGVATIVKDFDSETGIKEITVMVNNEAQDVKITVTKEDGRPADVSVSKTGKVYQYLHIETQNLAADLDKATVTFRVEKSWINENKANNDNIVISKFDEVKEQWNDLAIVSRGSDSLFYYYDVELTSFSYFAISEKAVVSEEDVSPAADEEGMSTWVWIVLVIVAALIVIWAVMSRKKRR